MGEILGLGLTHYPPLIGRDETMADILRTVMKDPGLPERFRDPSGWPEPMRREYAGDGGAGRDGAGRRGPARRNARPRACAGSPARRYR